MKNYFTNIIFCHFSRLANGSLWALPSASASLFLGYGADEIRYHPDWLLNSIPEGAPFPSVAAVKAGMIGVGTTDEVAPPSEPSRPISGTRLSSWWLTFKRSADASIAHSGLING